MARSSQGLFIKKRKAPDTDMQEDTSLSIPETIVAAAEELNVSLPSPTNSTSQSFAHEIAELSRAIRQDEGSTKNFDECQMILPIEERVERVRSQSPVFFNALCEAQLSDSLKKRINKLDNSVHTLTNLVQCSNVAEVKITLAGSRLLSSFDPAASEQELLAEVATKQHELREEKANIVDH